FCPGCTHGGQHQWLKAQGLLDRATTVRFRRQADERCQPGNTDYARAAPAQLAAPLGIAAHPATVARGRQFPPCAEPPLCPTRRGRTPEPAALGRFWRAVARIDLSASPC